MNKYRPNKKISEYPRKKVEKFSFNGNRFINPNRIKRPRRKIRLLPLFKLLAGMSVVVALSLLLIFINDLFTQADFFKIRNIEISGTRHLTTKEIIKDAMVAKGDNLLKANLGAVRKRLLSHPWIEDIQVSRNIPDTLEIRVKEHQPAAVVVIGNESYLLSNKGFIFKPLTDSDPQNLPLITGLTYMDIPVAEFPASAQFKAVKQVLEMGRESSVPVPTKRIRQIRLDRELGLTLEVIDPSLAIQIGYDQYPQKYDNLKRLIKYLKKGKEQIQVRTVDLCDLDQIVVTPILLDPPRQG